MDHASVQERVIGIRLLHCPTDEPEVEYAIRNPRCGFPADNFPLLNSIVAVHGLNGHAVKTWTTEVLTNNREEICWLSHPELLPKHVQRARVLTWGYNANVTSLRGPTSSNRVLQHAQNLVQDLQSYRSLTGGVERTIIFVCHSLGGIVVKRALAYSESRTAPKISHLRSIFTSTHSIVFFGTPHHGTSKAAFFGSLEKLTSMTIPKRLLRTESSLLKALKEESETLQNITDQFVSMMSHFNLMFLWEQERTSVPGMGRMYIVEESSAAPALPDVERCGIAADHREMCRFANSSDPGFLTIVEALRRYSQQAPAEIQKRWAQEKWLLETRRRWQADELVACRVELT